MYSVLISNTPAYVLEILLKSIIERETNNDDEFMNHPLFDKCYMCYVIHDVLSNPEHDPLF